MKGNSMIKPVRHSILLSFLLSSPTDGAWPNDLREDANLNGITFVDDQYGWCVGERGTILATRDGGRNWNHQKCPVACRLNSVHFIDRRTGWACGGFTIPYVSRSQGVVIHTDDGGQTWSPLDTSLLAELTFISFFGKNHGYALGNRSQIYPSGVFTTMDGGRSWSPLPSRLARDCVAGTFDSARNGMIVDRLGQLTRLAQGKRTPIDIGSIFRIRDAAMLSTNHGIACGDGGAILSSQNGGLTWAPVNKTASLPPIDYLTLETNGPNCWLAGYPGTIILRSEDAGRTWQATETDSTLPLFDLEFYDNNTGWAVGAFGTILHTSDGGRTWSLQRGERRRAATMTILAQPSLVSWHDVASESTISGMRSHFLFLNNPSMIRIGRTIPQDRTREALGTLGATTSPPLSNSTLFDMTSSRTIDNNAIGQTFTDVTDRISKEIRVWRPSIIRLQRPLGNRLSASRFLHDATQKAVAQASRPTKDSLRLNAWTVHEIWYGRSSDGNRTSEQLDLLTGLSTRDLASLAHATAHAIPVPCVSHEPRFYRFTTSNGNSRSTEDIAPPNPADSSFRRSRIPLPQDIRAKQKQNEARRNLEKIIAQRRTIGSATVVQQIHKLPFHLQGHVLFSTAQNAAGAGDYEFATALLKQIVFQLNQRRLAEPAAVALIQFLVSEERSIASNGRSISPTDRRNGRDTTKPPAQLVSITTNKPKEAALAQIQAVLQINPTWAFLPDMQFPHTSLQRRAKRLQPAQRFFESQARQQRDFSWRSCASCESWIINHQQKTLLRPIANCFPAQTRPVLDGQLNDPIWSDCKPIELRNQNIVSQIRFLHDDGFLYVGVSSNKLSGVEYIPRNKERVRDAPLDATDHIRFAFDVDRDFSTFWTMGIDHEGRCFDRLHGNISWNPQWYIASKSDHDAWRLEIAIPLDELTSKKGEQHAWYMGIRRIVPQEGIADWSTITEKSVEFSPSELGVLTFQSKNSHPLAP